MAGFLARRFLGFVATLLATAIIVFVALEILPGDPAAVMLGVTATPETIAALRTDLGLDQPAVLRFFLWLKGLATADLGESYAYRVPVAGLIGERLAVTLPLTLMAMGLSTAIGIPIGTYAASKAGKLADRLAMGLAELVLSIPNFWFGILFVLLFAVTLNWLPAGGFPGWEVGFGPAFAALLLPAVALALPQAAIIARLTRSSVLEALAEDWVLTARSKGLSRRATLYRHVLRNALVPVVTILGLQFSYLIAGTILIENVFSLPGLGRLIFQAIGQHDIIVVKDLVVLFAGLVVAVNFAVDLLYGIIDPRLKRERRR
ncbi:MAG: ABC transporter permease [Ancalomicrobiaceae bacterium]|nr:ABC transporter permease [Ancalomicrobiaceae bacterium]